MANGYFASIKKETPMKFRVDIEKPVKAFLNGEKRIAGRNRCNQVRYEAPVCILCNREDQSNDTGEESFGLLCYAEITEFATELHSEMEKIVLLDELPEEWTYPLIQPKLIEKYLQMKNTIDFRLRA